MSEPAALVRDRRWLAFLCLVSATLAPALLLAAVSIVVLPRDLLTEIAAPGAAANEAPAVLTALMSDMVNITIGLMIVGWFIYRRPVVKQAERWHLGIALATTGVGLASIFAGLRGEYALAFVLSSQPFSLAQISGFVETQASALMLQLMLTSLLACHFLIFRDRRTTLAA